VVVYRLTGAKEDAAAMASDICLEDTVELPYDLVTEGLIRDHIIGRVEDLRPVADGVFEARVSFAVETTAFEFTQFLNVAFGNVSLKPGIRVERFELPDSLLQIFRGPRFGVEGWRRRLGVPKRPLLCSALKPMGLSAAECAELAGKLASGGIDLIKDDHGLTDQPFARFEERAVLCAKAVKKSNEQTGLNCIYMPNVTAAPEEMLRRARMAREIGTGGLLVAPGLTGYDAMRRLADDDAVALPIMAHPSFQGSFVTNRSCGFSHGAIFGQLARLGGADATIFPNYGGRFSFTREECGRIVEFSRMPMGRISPIFPTPGGGMSLDRVSEMSRLYGNDVIYLIGAGLLRYSADLPNACRMFRRMAESSASADPANDGG